MKFPLINSDPGLLSQVEKALEQFARETTAVQGAVPGINRVIPLEDRISAIEFINYQTPPLFGINFSDQEIDGFQVMEQIISDPWLNHGAVIAFYQGSEVLEKINALEETNIVISVSHADIAGLFVKVLHIIQQNEQILFQRAIHSEFVSNLSGSYVLDPDIAIIPCYANLVANYLYNMGFVGGSSKADVGLSLTEMLINAIEHGVCGITSEEKTDYMETHGSILGLIAEKTTNPDLAARKVIFQYDIHAEQSTYVISDGGKGFDWRSYLDNSRKIDVLSQHGRGILLTRSAMDEVSYNELGNIVTVRVEHLRNTTNTVPLVFLDHETVEVQPGDMVFRQGEESDFLYYIAEGEFTVEINDVLIATVTPSDIILGEMSFLLQDNRSATVVAISPGKLIRISKNAFVNSIKAQPYYGLFLAKLLAQRLLKLGRRFAS